jgi:excinuclease ABC subunit C
VRVPVIGIAKENHGSISTYEEIYLMDQPEPVVLPRASQGLYLLQRVRDEAHRFAITFHRERRAKRMTRSILDGIPGLGPARKARLLKELGGVNAVRASTLEQLQALTWLPDAVALAVYEGVRDGAARGGKAGVR